MDIINFPAIVADTRVVDISQLDLDTDLMIIGKFNPNTRDGTQYRTLAMPIADLMAVAAGDWKKVGNVAAAGDFIGTLNAQDFRIRVNNLEVGLFEASSQAMVMKSPNGNPEYILRKIGVPDVAMGRNGADWYVREGTAYWIALKGPFGFMGIGTTTPTEKLHVIGSILMDDGFQSPGYVMATDAFGKGTWTDIATLIPAGLITGSGTINRAVTWTGLSTIGDGTWDFVGNDYVPVTTGSNLGSATNRISTIYMSSTVNYASTLAFFSGGTAHLNLTTAGSLGLGLAAPLAKFHIKGIDNLSSTFSFRVDSFSTNEIFTIANNGRVGVKLLSPASANFEIKQSTALEIPFKVDGFINVNAIIVNAFEQTGFGLNPSDYAPNLPTNAVKVAMASYFDFIRGGNSGVSFSNSSHNLFGSFLNDGTYGDNTVRIYNVMSGGNLGLLDFGNMRIGVLHTAPVASLHARGGGIDLTVFRVDNNADFQKFRVGNSANQVLDVSVGPQAANHITAAFQIDSTTQGFLPPRMTTAERTAIIGPATALVVYDTTNNQWMGYNGTSWVILG